MTELHADIEGIGIPASRSNWGRLVLMALLSTTIDIIAYWLLDHVEMGTAARTAVALLPLPPDLVLLVMILHRIRRLDEFQRRVQLEAVLVGFLATGVAVFVYGYLQKAHAVGPLNMGIVWAFMLMFYGIGYAAAVKHYR